MKALGIILGVVVAFLIFYIGWMLLGKGKANASETMPSTKGRNPANWSGNGPIQNPLANVNTGVRAVNDQPGNAKVTVTKPNYGKPGEIAYEQHKKTQQAAAARAAKANARKKAMA